MRLKLGPVAEICVDCQLTEPELVPPGAAQHEGVSKLLGLASSSAARCEAPTHTHKQGTVPTTPI